MKILRSRRLPYGLIAGILSLVAIRLVRAGPGQGSAPAPNSTQPAQYVGTEVCKTCHEDLFKKHFENTPHFKTTLANGHGCESCHGPGSEHVASGGDVIKIVRFKNLSKQETNAVCLSCHG